jgi:hypothetical protein
MSSVSPSTIRTLILVIIVCQAVLLVLDLTDFDPPLDLVTVGLSVLVIGLGFYMLRNPPRPREFGRRHRGGADDEG